MVKYIIGIDEVGRGPLAGPVTVCAVMMKKDTYNHLKKLKVFQDGKDSKKLSAIKREFYLTKIEELQKNGKLKYSLSFKRNTTIDKIGIAASVRRAIKKCLDNLNVQPTQSQILLDGGLKAPKIFPHQKTIIHGDEIELIISLSSIVAKVKRDRRMVKYHKRWPTYGFNENKGYGSSKHIKVIKKIGPCELHRLSYIKNI